MMTSNPVATNFGRAAIMVGVSSIVVLLLTSVHHTYGAVIYNTPWRNRVVLIAIPGALVIAALLFAARKYSNTTFGHVALWLAVIMVAVVPVGAIGLFEGGVQPSREGRPLLRWRPPRPDDHTVSAADL